MPIKSSKQFGLAGAVLGGKSDKMPASVAREMMAKTSPKKRKRFAKANAKKRKKGKPPAPGYKTMGERMMGM